MTALPETKSIDLEVSEGWLTIWFNQPERRNPLTDDVVAELSDVLSAVANNRDIRGITLRGRGGVFCAGGDLKAFSTMATGPRDETLAISDQIGRLLAALNNMPQVTVALVEGAAIAGGLGMACCCDVTIGTTDSRFAFSETRIGITPAQIARYVLQKCGYSTGRRLMLTAAKFKGGRAAQLGILDEVVDSVAALEDAERAIRREVLSCAPEAVAQCKRLISDIVGLDDATAIAYASTSFTDALQGPEGAEGVASFLEKRQPAWHVEVN